MSSPTPVCVLVTTHNSSKTIRAALRSIDQSFRGRPWALILSDDASRDHTVRLARETSLSCLHAIIHAWPKAHCIGEAKNRALSMYLPICAQYPVWTWVDGDDECLPGRAWLCDKMLEDGHPCAAGGHVDLFEGGTRDWVDVEYIERHCQAGMWGMVFRRECIPEDGKFFDETLGNSVHDDVIAIHECRRRGHEWGVYHGVDVAVYHRHEQGFMHSGEGGVRLRTQNTQRELLFRPGPSATDCFFTTMIGAKALVEGEVALRTLRCFHSQPIIVVTDRPEHVESWDLPGVRADGDYSVKERFAHIAGLYKGPPHLQAFFTHCIARLIPMKGLFTEYARILAFDSDFVFLREFPVLPKKWLMAAVHHRTIPPNPGTYFMHQFGLFNGGLVRICGDMGSDLRPWIHGAIGCIRHFTDRWKTERHSFTDQGHLMDLAWGRPTDFALFPPSCNLGASVLDGNEYTFDLSQSPKEAIRALNLTPIHLGHSLWYRGHSVRNLHGHFLGQEWNAPWPGLMRLFVKAANAYSGIEKILLEAERKYGVQLNGRAGQRPVIPRPDEYSSTPWGDAPP